MDLLEGSLFRDRLKSTQVEEGQSWTGYICQFHPISGGFGSHVGVSHVLAAKETLPSGRVVGKRIEVSGRLDGSLRLVRKNVHLVL